jgi:hypothetical protein
MFPLSRPRELVGEYIVWAIRLARAMQHSLSVVRHRYDNARFGVRTTNACVEMCVAAK